MRILFVCLGNICRSLTAEAVLKARLKQEGLTASLDSAGTDAWHKGESPDPRARATGEKRGYSFAGQSARKIKAQDFAEFDHIIAMDTSNLSNLHTQCPEEYAAKLGLFFDFTETHKGEDVPDPYYGGLGGFDHVVDLIEEATTA